MTVHSGELWILPKHCGCDLANARAPHGPRPRPFRDDVPRRRRRYVVRNSDSRPAFGATGSWARSAGNDTVHGAEGRVLSTAEQRTTNCTATPLQID